METTLPFQASVQATTQGEIWDHTDTKKFEQFGWRTTKNDDKYRTGAKGALLGNWVEDRNDVTARTQPNPLPHEHDHYFGTNYDQSYSSGTRAMPAPQSLTDGPTKREVRAYPCHQPEFDHPALKAASESYVTSNHTYGSKQA